MSDFMSEAARHERNIRAVGRAADTLAASLSDAKDAIFPLDTSFLLEVNEALDAQGLGVKLVFKESHR